jgi:methionyl-tRNA formyltransferase
MTYTIAQDRRELRVVFVTQEDPFYIPLFFREFFRLYRQRNPGETQPFISVRGVMVQRPLGNRTAKGLAKRIWRLYGTVGFAVMGARYVFRRLLRVLGPLSPTVNGAAARAGVPILTDFDGDANSTAFIEYLSRNEVDLVVSVSASQIFRESVLTTPRLGCINLHNAPLPHYRGMLPNFWQLYYGEPRSVLTIHRMVADLDAGDILLQRETPIRDEMSLEDLMRTTKTESARALWELLNGMLSANGVTTRPLPATEGSYFSWPTREHARELRRRGRRLL